MGTLHKKSRVVLIALSDKEYLENAGDRYPLGLLYVAGMLDRNNHPVKILDLNYDKHYSTIIKQFKPDYIGISFTTAQYKEAINLSVELSPIAKLVAGGVHPSIDPKSCEEFFDYIVVGEGEYAMLSIANGDAKEGIVNGIYVDDLDVLGTPAYHLIDMDRYNMQMEGNRTATLITSRGCPGSCIFCSKINGPMVRYHSAKYVLNQILWLNKFYSYESFYFLDDTFTSDSKRVIKLCKMIAERGLDLSLRVTTRADFVKPRVIKALAKVGLKIISLGIEHADNEVLRKCGKRMTIEQNLRAIRVAHKNGVKVKGFFIMNLPGATKETVKKTIKWARKHVDYPDFYRLVAFPGTPIWKHSEKLGLDLIHKDYGYWEAGKNKEANIENKEISNKDIDLIFLELRQ
jgi:radical SAM superfamily enzyme YgiQ (UPF0313 family)